MRLFAPALPTRAARGLLPRVGRGLLKLLATRELTPSEAGVLRTSAQREERMGSFEVPGMPGPLKLPPEEALGSYVSANARCADAASRVHVLALPADVPPPRLGPPPVDVSPGLLRHRRWRPPLPSGRASARSCSGFASSPPDLAVTASFASLTTSSAGRPC